MTKKTRKFNGKIYNLVGEHSYKIKAIKQEDGLRKNHLFVRMIKTQDGYQIWARQDPNW